ncbi:L domain-like protein [Macroventuria anomochaeta]|uniref:L domain-like protein n=1 Tax=Macroventuria anomochaeta TaxID=301207 RepID=A0ACB6SKC6_9PLEO|nr:L domain-like protein [Macroventuria anomochaeta]KAF2633877.1 L domain-like protein [Macroventuria anomochaeta]
MDPPSNLPRPSGLPRPATSRLPVLRPSGSQPQLRSPASSSQLRKKPPVASISRPAPQPAQTQAPPRAAAAPPPPPPPAPAPTVQRKPSRVSLAPSHAPSHAPSTTAAAPNPNSIATLTKRPSRASLVPSSARRVSGIPSSGVPPTRNGTATQHAPAFKKPFARPPSRQSRTPSQPVRTPSISKEDDVLGSLDGFRSASRASSRAGSRAGFHESSSSPEYVPDVEPEEVAKRKSRPSLSDRTIESLSQLPSSPANGKGRRRRSSFFNQDNTMPPPLRPASAMSNRSNGSRPTTSDGTGSRLPATPSKPSASSTRLSMTVPGKRSASAVASTPTATPSRISSISRPTTAIKKSALGPIQNIQTPSKPAPLSSSKGLASRTPKARPPVASTFGQAISPPGVAAAPSPPPPTGTARKVPSSSATLRNSIAQAKAARRQEVGDSPNGTPKKAENSSNALREQIAKAREAAKRNKAGPVRADTPPKDAILPDPDEIAGFDFGLGDPFNQNSKAGQSVLRNRVDGARTTGRLNIAGMQLTEMPDEVLCMYDPNDSAVAWGEIVDVTTIVAADNELETLPDSMFPDVAVEDFIDSDDAGPQFGGVQHLDFHGNLLRELPMGLRRLAELTQLNLSRNKLRMGAFDVITQIASLRELKLAENNLEGELPSSIASLTQLEVLDVASNKLIGLPAEIRELMQLRSINVADNQLRTAPMELFTSTSLIEFTATKNRLEGTFFTIQSAPHLQELRLSGNALTSLSESGNLNLPALKYLDLSANRLSSLPDMTSWTNLGTILLGENKVTAFPEGFLSLKQLRIADFTANDISKVDERIALMDGLENLTLAANPIRERKFLTMSTDDMKRDLYARLRPEETVTGPDEDDGFPIEEQAPESSKAWTVTPSGTLDLTNKGFTVFNEDALIALAETSDIRQINVQNNLLQTIPLAFGQLSYLTILDLSKNSISNPLTSPLELPRLRELRLSGNKLSSLTPLTAPLTAPSLQSLDISQNRLTGSLPGLRNSFPALITLIASDNAIIDVPAESLSGLKIVNLSNNNIERLDPRIGLHAGTLTSLVVEGNKFRVPNYQVLSKGTDAILSWLKDKIPRDSGRGRGDSTASTATRTTEGGSEFFDAEDGVDTW